VKPAVYIAAWTRRDDSSLSRFGSSAAAPSACSPRTSRSFSFSRSAPEMFSWSRYNKGTRHATYSGAADYAPCSARFSYSQESYK